MKQVYLFDEVTGEFAGIATAHESPLEPGVYLEPTYSTSAAPPVLTANQCAVFVSGAWSVMSDYRGQTVYDKTTGAPSIVIDIGTLSDNLTETPPLPTIDQLASQARGERNARLVEADMYVNVIEDAGGNASAARAYRQALRDVPAQKSFPNKIKWPVMPI